MQKDFLQKYFTESVMSVHLRQHMYPQVKRGAPGNWQLEILDKEKELTGKDMEQMIDALLKEIEEREDAFIEKEGRYSKVLQVGEYRIVVTNPPLSSVLEMTVIKPVKRLHLEDYDLSESLKKRLAERAEGVLIAGAPGNGKTTFAQALLELYYAGNKIIKTIEVPRDLHVPDGVTQYSLSHSSLNEIRDLLLLTRPDYTFFDEVRNPEDFHLYKDLRLTGIGMVGVIHAAAAIDAIQRFIGKIELGMITEVIDTLIYIEKGQVADVFALEMKVKVPHGMMHEDLARPVILIKNAQTDTYVYEIYTFGDQTVVMPLDGSVEGGTTAVSGLAQLGVSELRRRLKQQLHYPFEVQAASNARIKLRLDERDKGAFIGKGGVNIKNTEEMFGLKIDLVDEQLPKEKKPMGKQVDFTIEETKKGVLYIVPHKEIQEGLLVFQDGSELGVSANRRGLIKVAKKGKIREYMKKGTFKLFEV